MNSRSRIRYLFGHRWAERFNHPITQVQISRHTGFEGIRWRGIIPYLRYGYYWVDTDRSVIGDAPKDFIRVYERGTGRRSEPDSWPAYIAKIGHKWYPAESVTEQLMTRIGEFLGCPMANSRLMYAAAQIRFLSRYFLREEESLVHGAEIIAGYLVDDKFVEDVGQQHLEKEIFTFQVLCEAIRTRFPIEGINIVRRFVQMIGFDALIGNQDRHLYNWGVIVHTKGTRAPVFSPIYDTARGLFWNYSDSSLSKYETSSTLLGYIQRARPLIGWDRESDVNHFRLVKNISSQDVNLRDQLRALAGYDQIALERMIDSEFSRLLSKSRLQLIKQCLRIRRDLYCESVT